MKARSTPLGVKVSPRATSSQLPTFTSPHCCLPLGHNSCISLSTVTSIRQFPYTSNFLPDRIGWISTLRPDIMVSIGQRDYLLWYTRRLIAVKVCYHRYEYSICHRCTYQLSQTIHRPSSLPSMVSRKTSSSRLRTKTALMLPSTALASHLKICPRMRCQRLRCLAKLHTE